MKTLPDFSNLSKNQKEERYRNAFEVSSDYKLVIDAFNKHFPTELEEEMKYKLCRIPDVKFQQFIGKTCPSCSKIIPAFMTNVFYIGPERNSNPSNCLSYPPTVKFKGTNIVGKTTLRDIFFSYQKYSEKENVSVTYLSYGNRNFDLDRKVFDVLKTDKGFDKHYFSFPFDIKSGDLEEIQIPPIVFPIHLL